MMSEEYELGHHFIVIVDNMYMVPYLKLFCCFRSTGFVLEGFPRTPDEARYLAETGLFPDAALILTVEDTDVIGRLLPPKMDKWKAKRDKRLAKKQRIKDKAKKKRDALIAKRRDELLKEMAEKKAERAVSVFSHSPPLGPTFGVFLWVQLECFAFAYVTVIFTLCFSS